MNSEINFLRDEIKNKNKIIELLLSDRNHSHISLTQGSSKQTEKSAKIFQNDFEFPKRHANSQLPKQNNFIHQNQFDALIPFHETFNDDNDDNRNENNKAILVTEPNDQIKHNHQRNNGVTVRRRGKKKSDENKNTEPKRVVAIIGDSMIKYIQGRKLSSDKHFVVSKHFSGAKTKCMHHYALPTIERNPDELIIHCGTNDLKSDTSAHQKALDIVNLSQLVNVETAVVFSSLIHRNDELDPKVNEVNVELEKLCHERNIGFINNDNIKPDLHLNNSRIHLNKQGTALLAKNFLHHLNC